MPDLIASPLSPYTTAAAPNDSVAADPNPALPTPPPCADGQLPADDHVPSDSGWHRLPAELLIHIASFLPWQALDALGRTHHRTRDALVPATVASRLGWRIASVSSRSLLARTLGELRHPALSDAQRAQGLGALTERLPSLHRDMLSAARDALLGSIAALPAPLRAGPLLSLMQGLMRALAHRREPIVLDDGAWPLLAAVRALPPAQHAAPLIACLQIDSLAAQALPTVGKWIDTALRLPIPDRGAVLAQVLRRFSFASASRTDERVQRYLKVCAELRMPDGTPSWKEQAELLAAFATALDRHWARAHTDHDAHALWGDLLDAANRLPAEFALDVMLALAGRGAMCRGEGATEPVGLLWQAGQRFADDPTAYARWLATLATNGAGAQSDDMWDRLNEAARTLPPTEQAGVLATLASRVRMGGHASDLPDRWRRLFEQIVATLPAAARTEPLAALADALVGEGARMEDTRWQDLESALPSLAPASQVRILLACIDESTAERFWDQCRSRIIRLPVEDRGPALVNLADRLVHLRAAAHRADAWSDIAASLPALRPEQRRALWQMLVRRLNSAFLPDLQARQRALDTLAGLLAELAPIARQQCLLTAAWQADVDRCQWILTQLYLLPAALQADVLVRVAACAGADRWLGWNPEQRVRVWIDLLDAVRQLPTHYRGAPLHQLAQLLADLPPGTMRHRARQHFRALLRGVSPLDIPAGFEPFNPLSESAMVRRALKRPRFPEPKLAVSPKRERIDETWP